LAKDNSINEENSTLKPEDITRVFRIGETVQAELVQGGRNSKFQCRIKQIDECSVHVVPIDYLEEQGSVPLGGRVSLSNIIEGVMYSLEAMVAEVDESNRIKLALESQSAMEQRRKLTRVECYIPFRYRVLSEEEFSRAQKLIMEKPSPTEGAYFDFAWTREAHYNDILSDPLGRLLMEINFKLDRLLFTLGKQSPEGFNEGQAEELNLSGSGLAFKAQSEIPLGTVMEVEFALPLFPSAHIRALGEVVRVEKLQADSSNLDWMIGIEFMAINEADREEIIRYTFIRQRQLLRNLH